MDAKILDKLDMMIVLGAKDCGNDDVDMLDNLDTSKVTYMKAIFDNFKLTKVLKRV